MNTVYIPIVVRELTQLYGNILGERHLFSSIKDHHYGHAAKMREVLQNNVLCIY